jgi:hypothetical protein
MLIKFTDSYENTITLALEAIGDINFSISKKEPYMGNSVALDVLYAQSTIMSGIVDYIQNNDGSNPKEDEALLLSLKSLVDKHICLPKRNKIKKTSQHITS